MEVIENNNSKEPIEENIIKMAQRRVSFKKHLMSYLIVSCIFWSIWLVSGMGYPWPVWPMFGWGIAIAFNYMSAYKNSSLFSVENEIDQIKKERQQS
ncbi:MAG: 2TM domain-containing protein [Chitinophagales bacterium]|nr:2TM domain-containing protein [Chitinophagales bacterium]